MLACERLAMRWPQAGQTSGISAGGGAMGQHQPRQAHETSTDRQHLEEIPDSITVALWFDF